MSENQLDQEIEVLTEDVSDSPLYSADLAPVPKSGRTWNVWHLASIWVGMAVCIPTYILASYMIRAGLSWYAALVIIGLANLIITVPMILNGHAGVKYGIPFPVFGRASFGTDGIHIASLVRAIVACGWFGVQTWIGGLAFYEIWCAISGAASIPDLIGIKFVCFGLFWLVNVFFIWNGTESIKWLEAYSAPILIILGIALIGWGAYQADGFSIVLDQSRQLETPTATLTPNDSRTFLTLKLSPLKNKEGTSYKASQYQLILPNRNGSVDNWPWVPVSDKTNTVTLKENGQIDLVSIFAGDEGKEVKVVFRGEAGGEEILSSEITVPVANADGEALGSKVWSWIMWLTVMVGFWATMSLSISDITRYAASQKDQAKGQFIGLPGTMILYSFVGVFVTCAAVINFDDILVGEDAPWDPVTLLGKFQSPVVVVISQIFMLIATLSTNIAANVIAPANAFSNLAPKKIGFKQGGIITAVIGVVICPWWLLNDISNLLIVISGLLGPVLGILLADYFVVRKMKLNLNELYKVDGEYSYGGSGFNKAAVVSLVVGVSLAIVGLIIPQLEFLYNLSWFIGFGVSFALYAALFKKMNPNHKWGNQPLID